MATHHLTKDQRERGNRRSRALLAARGKSTRDDFLDAYHATGSRQQAVRIVDRTVGTLDNWRQKYPEFKAKMDEITMAIRAETTDERREVQASFQERTGKFVDIAEIPPEILEYDEDSFEEFRLLSLKTTTPPHQQLAVRLWDTCELGNIIMMLWPPEHGKTTLAEDFLTYKIVQDRQFRTSVGSEKQGLARRIIGRIRNRFEQDGPFPKMVQRYGPFSPNDDRLDRPPPNKVWGADQWNVIGKEEGDERDFTAVALGINGTIAGTRTDQLLCDDITSLVNYRQTHTDEGIVNKFRQDWLSRPGEWGRTAVNGTRVGVNDFYEAIEDVMPDHILTVVRQPAITWDPELGRYRPLWPERYNMEQLNRMREKVGEDAWARNYMQQPSARSESTFPRETTDPCKNPLISVVEHDIPLDHGFIACLDPAIGGVNVWTIIEFTSQWMMPVWIERTVGLISYDQIFSQLDQLLARFTSEGASCETVIIEEKHFQSGLMADSRIEALQDRYGFAVEGHKTGSDKADPDIGIPAIPTTMRRGEFIIPWADDETTRHMMGDLIREMERWRRYVKGTDLEQDRVITVFFGHRWWQQSRQMASRNRESRPIKIGGLPYAPTGASGLHLPSGFRG